MNYADGNEARLGDHVQMGDDKSGIVVCDLDRGEFSPEHPIEQWGYLRKGCMVEFGNFGVIHFPQTDPDNDLVLIRRANDLAPS